MGLSRETLGAAGPVCGPGAGAGRPGVVVVHGDAGPGAGWPRRLAGTLAPRGRPAPPVPHGEGASPGAGGIGWVDSGLLPEAARAPAGDGRGSGRAGRFGLSKSGEAARLAAAAFDPAAFRAGGGGARAADAPGVRVREGRDGAPGPGAAISVGLEGVPLLRPSGTADEVVPRADTVEKARRLGTAGPAVALCLAQGQRHGPDVGVERALRAGIAAVFGGHPG